MKLCRVYCTLPRLFGPIRFNGVKNDTLSVVFARITRPKDEKRDSHNLGKTTLIHLLDFMLLKDVNEDNCFLIKHRDRFEQFIFFLEIFTNQNDYVTVRRSVEAPTRIALKRHGDPMDLANAAAVEWDHEDTPIETARSLLDSYLDLTVIRPWDYRKGVSYFLRTQADYQDYFQISKFQKGQDSQWKPYMAHLMGLNHERVERKYAVDAEIGALERLRDEAESEVQLTEAQYSNLQLELDIERQEAGKASEAIDLFSFREEEKRLNKALVEDIERRISELNTDIYRASYDLQEMKDALEQGFNFKVNAVRQIFEETRTYVPESLLREYDDLVAFNKKITNERNRLLRREIRDLEADLQKMNAEAEILNLKRVQQLQVLRDADAFSKFKGIQSELATHQARITYLEGQMEKVTRLREIGRQIRDLQVSRSQIVNEITNDVEQANAISRKIGLEFHSLVRRVLDLDGSCYAAMNKSGNIDFKIETKLSGKNGPVSSQSEGTSYKKLLCALFDITLLIVYANANFYHFVYHDGIFEGLDNRKRRVLLSVLREVATKNHIQYVLSVIDSDLPRDDQDRKMQFTDEVILELNDEGPKGRLFRMSEF